jgi:hypothetical protein
MFQRDRQAGSETLSLVFNGIHLGLLIGGWHSEGIYEWGKSGNWHFQESGQGMSNQLTRNKPG